MARAYYGDRVYAELVVFKKGGKWWLRLAMKEFGPYPSKARAVAAAIDAAKEVESTGRTGRVQEQIGVATFKTVWPRPKKVQ